MNLLPLVIEDALTVNPLESLKAIQRDITKRSLHNQAHLRDLIRERKERENELRFNVLVNIVLGTPKPKSKTADDIVNSFLSPLELPAPKPLGNISMAEGSPGFGATSVDRWDSTWLPCKRNVYLEVRGVEAENGQHLHWRLDYTSGTLAPDKALQMLQVIEELEYVLGYLQ